MAKLTWVVEIAVDESWVADGFTLTADRVKEIMLDGPLGFATEDEVDARILSAPDLARIEELQSAG